MSGQTVRGRDGGRPMLIRKIPFAYVDSIEPIWNPKKPEWSHMVNGASLTMPYLEPFLIKTVREAMMQLTDEGLKADARGFIGQEGQHYMNHQRYNDTLKRKGYTDLSDVEAEMTEDYKRLQGKSLRWRLAYTAGFETMTMGITEWLISARKDLFVDADPVVTSLVLWHMVEETEHKTVAFELYQELFGNYFARLVGLVYATYHISKFSRRAYKRMMKRDGTWGSLRCRFRLWAMVAKFGWNIAPALLRSLFPGHHPDHVTDPAWVTEWADAYAGLSGDDMPLLDTRDPEVPARFASI
ncbi:MAG: metal-dependent hydrolase [Parvibaculaceae bacterium]|nr:metal-dependent hydrolase [Parvibaculaceae bacterium]